MTQHTCYWWVDAPPPATYRDAELPSEIDVAVIGGGFTGTSAALRLARSGTGVALLEAESIGWGASSRNGGQALSCLHHSLSELVDRYGETRAREMFAAATRAADCVARLVAEHAIDCDYRRAGNLEAASKPGHFERLKREQEVLERVAGYPTRLVQAGDVGAELGTAAYHGLLVNERSAGLQPASFVAGLALAAQRAGAQIFEGARVTRIARSRSGTGGPRFHLHTARGVLRAREVLLATNAWTGRLVPHFRSRVLPAESFIIATEPLPAGLAARLIPHRRVVYDTKKLVAYYTVSRDNRVLWGGEATATGLGARSNIAILRRGMTRVFPELRDAAIDYFWSGTLGVTLDENVHAGQQDGMWFSMCYEGHGVTLGTYMGEQVANALLGEESFNPFGGGAIPRVPFAAGRAGIANLAKAWFRLLDLFG